MYLREEIMQTIHNINIRNIKGRNVHPKCASNLLASTVSEKIMESARRMIVKEKVEIILLGRKCGRIGL
jgi:hypothetical protein